MKNTGKKTITMMLALTLAANGTICAVNAAETASSDEVTYNDYVPSDHQCVLYDHTRGAVKFSSECRFTGDKGGRYYNYYAGDEVDIESCDKLKFIDRETKEEITVTETEEGNSYLYRFAAAEGTIDIILAEKAEEYLSASQVTDAEIAELPEITVSAGSFAPVIVTWNRGVFISGNEETAVFVRDTKTDADIHFDFNNQAPEGIGSWYVYALSEGETTYTMTDFYGNVTGKGTLKVTAADISDPAAEKQKSRPVMVSAVAAPYDPDIYWDDNEAVCVLYDDGTVYKYQNGRYIKSDENIKKMYQGDKGIVVTLDNNGILKINDTVKGENVKDIGITGWIEEKPEYSDRTVYVDAAGRYFDTSSGEELVLNGGNTFEFRDDYNGMNMGERVYSSDTYNIASDITVTNYNGKTDRCFSVRDANGTEFFCTPAGGAMTHVKNTYGLCTEGESFSVLLEREDGTVWKYDMNSGEFTKLVKETEAEDEDEPAQSGAAGIVSILRFIVNSEIRLLRSWMDLNGDGKVNISDFIIYKKQLMER